MLIKGKMPVPAPRQQGVTLIISVLMLFVTTLLALSMYHGLGMRTKIAGNSLEKQRAFQAAQSALEYAEWWMRTKQAAPMGDNCDSAAVINVDQNEPKVCASALADPSAFPWSTRNEVTPPAMKVGTGGGLEGADAKYYGNPAFHIEKLNNASLSSSYYRITAAAYGGQGSSIAVVQSVFSLTPENPSGTSGTGIANTADLVTKE